MSVLKTKLTFRVFIMTILTVLVPVLKMLVLKEDKYY